MKCPQTCGYPYWVFSFHRWEEEPLLSPSLTFHLLRLPQIPRFLKEKICPFGKDCHYFYHVYVPVFLLTRLNGTVSSSFLHFNFVSYWAPAPFNPPVWKKWHLFAVKICCMIHGSVKKVPDVSFQETSVTKLQLAVATSHSSSCRPAIKFTF